MELCGVAGKPATSAAESALVAELPQPAQRGKVSASLDWKLLIQDVR